MKLKYLGCFLAGAVFGGWIIFAPMRHFYMELKISGIKRETSLMEQLNTLHREKWYESPDNPPNWGQGVYHYVTEHQRWYYRPTTNYWIPVYDPKSIYEDAQPR